MDTLTIYYGVQGNGIRFGLPTDEYKMLRKQFPNAQPSKGVFVEYDMRVNFAEYHPHLEQYVFPALVGMPNTSDLKIFKRVNFVQTPEMIVTYTIEQNSAPTHEQKVQSLSW